MLKKNIVSHTALFIALLFHISGLVGILFTSQKEWFIQNTPVNLLVMALMLVITQPQKNSQFLLFLVVTCLVGFACEIIGTSMALLFGNYTYGNVLGIKLSGVPLVIAINWFIIIYCAGVATQFYENRMLRRLHERGITISPRMKIISFVTDAALLCVLFDWLMEPVAQKLGYWQWEHGHIPVYNYICWIFISALLLALFRRLDFRRNNIFAVHLFFIQALFFLVLRTFL